MRLAAQNIAIQFAASRRNVPHPRALKLWASAALLVLGSRTPRENSLTLRIVGASEGRRLNHRWRGKDYPTNVLSFSYSSPSAHRLGPSASYLGDLVICAPVVAREAREQGKPLSAHWAHMVVHGVLHLLGHDHVKSRDAKRMETLEVEILSRFGYQDPYFSHEDGSQTTI